MAATVTCNLFCPVGATSSNILRNGSGRFDSARIDVLFEIVVGVPPSRGGFPQSIRFMPNN